MGIRLHTTSQHGGWTEIV